MQADLAFYVLSKTNHFMAGKGNDFLSSQTQSDALYFRSRLIFSYLSIISLS